MNYHKKSVADINVSGKKVLVRCDFNVPLNEDGVITDDIRIRSALPTVQYLLDQGAAIILCSHMGRPKGKWDPKFSMKPAAERLSRLLDKPVPLVNDVVGAEAKAMAAALQPGQLMMLENVRFCPEEEKNDPAFAKELASMAEIFVNDAFGTAHRAHASTAGVAAFLPAVGGFLIEKEITVMGKAMEAPEHPFVAILGGAKVGEKLQLIEKLLSKCDSVLVLGGMSYTFQKAEGGDIGDSLCDDGMLELVRGLVEKAEKLGVKLLLPVDNIAADAFRADAKTVCVSSGSIPHGYMGMDIGPKTIEMYTKVIHGAKTVVWNGPAGVFEMPAFAKGTESIARAVAETDCVSIIGGGDSAAAIEQMGYSARVTHISTGGGASIEFLQGLELPGIACLQDVE